MQRWTRVEQPLLQPTVVCPLVLAACIISSRTVPELVCVANTDWMSLQR